MKNWPLSLGLALVFLCGVQTVRAASDENARKELFSKIKISLSTGNPPRPASSNSTPSSNCSWRNKWLIVAVEYTPTLPQRVRHYWIDDVSLEIRAIFNGQTGGRTQAVLFTGKSIFRTIPIDNRKHTATMMVPPQLLDRYLPSSGTGSTVSVGSTFTIEAVFRDRAGAVIGIGYYGQRSWSEKTYAKYFAQLNGGAVKTVRDAIYPRNLTPWAFHDIDNYDILKPGGVGGTIAD